LAEWLYERGIGENRAALIDRGEIVEMALEWDDDPEPRAGAVLPARLVRRADTSGRGIAALGDGTLVQLQPVPAALAEGGTLAVEILREALPERGVLKPARAAPVEAAPHAAPDLLARLRASGLPIREGADLLEPHGWSERIEQAQSGIVPAPDVLLHIALTPAMTLIDVDGAGDAQTVALAGARAAGAAIRLFGIEGSIGIDLPTLTSRADRLAAAQVLDAMLPPPFERTAVNGFGFVQIVRRRRRASLSERLANDPLGGAARVLLRRGERARGHGTLTLTASTQVLARLAARPDWIERLAQRAGAAVTLQANAALAISAGHAARAQP
jgi:hypothetical protein